MFLKQIVNDNDYYSLPTTNFTRELVNKVLPSTFGALLDSSIDILQTGLVYVLILQSQSSYSFKVTPASSINGIPKESLTPLMDNSIFKPTYI